MFKTCKEYPDHDRAGRDDAVSRGRVAGGLPGLSLPDDGCEEPAHAGS